MVLFPTFFHYIYCLEHILFLKPSSKMVRRLSGRGGVLQVFLMDLWVTGVKYGIVSNIFSLYLLLGTYFVFETIFKNGQKTVRKGGGPPSLPDGSVGDWS